MTLASRVRLDEAELRAGVQEMLARRSAVGLALGVIHGGGLRSFLGHGVADIETGTPMGEDTVFRIGSLTKLFTAVAVMQLWELGLVGLDTPASEYLRAYRLRAANPGFRPVTLRHLLTHTAGIPDVRDPRDLLHFGWGPLEMRPALDSVPLGMPLPSLADYYGDGLRVVVEPGTTFAYSNHGFATLGQIVEDVSGMPLDRYLRARIFEPLGMATTDLRRSASVAGHLAVGYAFGRHGPEPIADRVWMGLGAGGIYASTRDMARFVAALLGGGAGAVLRPSTLALMIEPQWQTDPRLTSIGLAFFLDTAGEHRLAGHEGLLPGFNSYLLMAPDDELGLVAFTNGSSGAMPWLPAEITGLLHKLLGVPTPGVRTDIAQDPEVWRELCGRYRLPDRVSDLRGRLLMGRGAEVYVQGGRLMVRVLSPIPGMRRGFELHPDDPADPLVFRIAPSGTAAPTIRVIFARGRRGAIVTAHTDLGGQPISFIRSPTPP